MVHRDRRDQAQARPGDDVGGVQPAAETGLEQHPVAGSSRKARKAAAVVISKKVIAAPALAASQRSRQAARRASASGVPSFRIRSLKRTRWGEM